MAKKVAFLVGINEHTLAQHNLRGCVNDVENLRSILVSKFNFENGDIQLLTNSQATRDNIIAGLTNLVQGKSAGDVLVFAFSGHGTQKGIMIADEVDGKNEAIVPYNVSYNNLITDDEINNIIASNITDPSISFTGIYDCCHSGTLTREFSINYSFSGYSVEDNVINRFIPAPFLGDELIKDIQLGPYNVFSACKDEETAADLKEVKGDPTPSPCGAFSYALHKIISDNPNILIQDLESRILEIISGISKHEQTPQYYAVDRANKIFG